MKKTKFVLAVLLIIILCASIFVGCAEEKSDLTIRVSKLGYGTEWLKAIAKAYEEKTGTTVTLKEAVGESSIDAIYAEQEAYSNRFDMYITRHMHYFETIYKGGVTINGQIYDCQYADLTEVYKDTTYGKSIEERMKTSHSSFYKVNNIYYGLPWATDDIMGIIKNNDVWEQLGLTDEDIPRTTTELFALCDKINAIKSSKGMPDIAPFIYSYDNEYYTPFVPIWFAQYEGVENTNKFINGLDLNGEQTYNLYAYTGLEKALEVLQALVSQSNGYQHKASADLTFTQMQSYFLADQAVFNVNGGWIETEMGANAQGKDIEYIPTPIISAIAERLSFYNKNDLAATDAKLAELVSFVDANPSSNESLPSGVTAADADIVREARQSASYKSESIDHIVTVPAHTPNLQTAKDFLKFMYSDEGLQLYYDNTAGNMLPFTKEGGYGTTTTISSFRKNINEITTQNYSLNWSAHMATKLYALGGVNVYYKNGITNTVMKELYAGTSPAEIITINISHLEKNWNSIVGKFN